MGMSCTPRRPDLMLEYQDRQRLITADTACPNEANKTEKQAQKNTKVPTIVFEVTRKTSWIFGKSCPNSDWMSGRWNKTTRIRC